MSDELKPCPFCGGNDRYTDDYGDVGVKCLYLSHGDTWNTRPLEDSLRAELAAKDAEIERLRQALENIVGANTRGRTRGELSGIASRALEVQ